MNNKKDLMVNNNLPKTLKLEPQETLGKFFINKDGVFDFEGDCTESAKVFVREVKKIFNTQP